MPGDLSPELPEALKDQVDKKKNLHITRLSESRVCVIVGMFQAMRNN